MSAPFETETAPKLTEPAVPTPTPADLEFLDGDTEPSTTDPDTSETSIIRGYDEDIREADALYQEKLRDAFEIGTRNLERDIHTRVMNELIDQYFEGDNEASPATLINLDNVEAAVRHELALQKEINDKALLRLKKYIIPSAQQRLDRSYREHGKQEDIQNLTADIENFKVYGEVTRYMNGVITTALNDDEDAFRDRTERYITDEIKDEAEERYKVQLVDYVRQLEQDTNRANERLVQTQAEADNAAVTEAITIQRQKLDDINAEIEEKTQELQKRIEELRDLDILLWEREVQALAGNEASTVDTDSAESARRLVA